ncbi:MAG: CRISPR-associated endonuclease Cas2 [Candidatus Kapabacteria bacterium]|nr:CRISPR-associated endonuclease Cas2 [Ignavibacteriota bacterium]MCW5883398.1 CRISPR-associated endonuclease Cas2 [Candidatus Kapabacteria bacterium]
MYCILVYDVGEKRVGKMLKHFRQYLNWIQNSVFEGELTKGQFDEMMGVAKKLMKKEEDSIILFSMQSNKYLDKKIYGVDKSGLTSNFI